MTNKTAIIIFTRVPLPGRTKTRLLTGYSEAVVTDLSRFFIELVCDKAALAARIIGADVFVFYTPASEEAKLKAIISYTSWNYLPQMEGDIWQKMNGAFLYAFDQGYSEVILTGTDVPEIEAEDFISAKRALEHKDLAIAPSDDGGYFLMAQRRHVSEVFFGLGKEEPTVCERTIEALRGRASYELLEKRHDIDTPEDMELLLTRWEKGGEKCRKNLDTILSIISKN